MVDLNVISPKYNCRYHPDDSWDSLLTPRITDPAYPAVVDPAILRLCYPAQR